MKRTLLSDLLYIYNTIDCEDKCSIYCPNRLRCDILKNLIISISSKNKTSGMIPLVFTFSGLAFE